VRAAHSHRLEPVAQLAHRYRVVPADVDGTEQGDAGRHDLVSTNLMVRSVAITAIAASVPRSLNSTAFQA
jgi:hypothetical protein